MKGYLFGYERISMTYPLISRLYPLQFIFSYPNISHYIHRYPQISIWYPTIYPFISMDLSIDIHGLILCNILWYPHWYPKTYPCLSKYLSFWYPVVIQRYPVLILLISSSYPEISFSSSCWIFYPDSAGPACPGVQLLEVDPFAQATVFIYPHIRC